MTLRNACLMTLVLLLGAGFVWFYERSHPEPPADEAKGKLLDTLKTVEQSQVNYLSIVKGAGSYTLKKKEAVPVKSWFPRKTETRWVLSLEYPAPVEQEVVSEILRSLFSLRYYNTISIDEQHEDPGVYGLQPPELFVRIKGDFKEKTLSFGKRHRLSGRRYLQIEQDPTLYLVDDALFTSVSKSRKDVRIKRPFEFPVKNVLSVFAVKRDKSNIHLKRSKQSDAWAIDLRPGEIPADNELIIRELRRLSELRVKNYIDKATHGRGYYGLVNPILTLRIEIKDEQDPNTPGLITLQVGRGAPVDIPLPSSEKSVPVQRKQAAYYAKILGEPWVYEIESPFYRAWLQGPSYFRSKTPFRDINLDKISKFKALLPSKNMQLIAELGSDDSWSLALDGGKSRAAGENEIAQMLENLLSLRVLSYADAADVPKEQESSLELELYMAAEKSGPSLRVGSAVSQAGGAGDDNAPRYALLGVNGEQLNAVLSAETVLKLKKIVETLAAEF